MVRAPNWSESEFEIVTNNYGLSDEELMQRLPRRSSGAIGIVREGIHRFHMGKENRGILSRMMLHNLKKRQEKRQGSIICHKCGKQF